MNSRLRIGFPHLTKSSYSRSNAGLLPCGRPRPARDVLPSPQRLEGWRQQLRNHLMECNLKYTEQRWKIAKTILATGGHLDVQGLDEKVKEKHPEIGTATVYRTIKVLCDAQILKESLTDVNGRVIYELFDDEHHDHIICLDCSEIFEFHDENIESRQKMITENLKFDQVRHRHVIYASCQFKKA